MLNDRGKFYNSFKFLRAYGLKSMVNNSSLFLWLTENKYAQFLGRHK